MQAGVASGSNRLSRVVAYTTVTVIVAAAEFVWLLLMPLRQMTHSLANS